MEAALAAAGLSTFFVEMIAPLLVCWGLPLGIPPGKEDPALARVAPEECLFYAAWAGTVAPDPKSKNRAEQFLAEPEVRRLFSEAGRRLATLCKVQSLSGDAWKGDSGAKGPFSQVAGRDFVFWSHLLFSRPAACYVTQFAPDTGRFSGAFLLNVGPSKEKVAKLLEEYRQIAKDRVRQSRFGGRTEYLFRSDDGQTQVTWTMHLDYLIVAAGDESPEKIIERMSGHEPKWLTAARQQVPIERRALTARLDCRAMAALAQDQDPQKQIRGPILGVPRSIVLATGLEGEDFVSRLHVELDPISAKVIHSLAGRPLKPEDLAPVPRDATLAMALRADPNYLLTLYDTAAAMVGAGETSDAGKKDAADSQASVFEAETARRLASALDDVWTLYSSPAEGGILIAGLTGTVRLKDHAEAARILQDLAARHQPPKAGPENAKRNPAEGVEWYVAKLPFAGRDIFYLMKKSEAAIGVLSWCLTDKELVFALSPQNIKAYLLRDAAFQSLAADPAVTAALKAGPPPTVFCYENTPVLFRDTYPMMQWMASAAASAAAQTDSNGEQPSAILDPTLLPAAPTIARHLRPGTTGVTVTPKGIEITARQSLPGGNLAGTLLVVFSSLVPSADGPAFRVPTPKDSLPPGTIVVAPATGPYSAPGSNSSPPATAWPPSTSAPAYGQPRTNTPSGAAATQHPTPLRPPACGSVAAGTPQPAAAKGNSPSEAVSWPKALWLTLSSALENLRSVSPFQVDPAQCPAQTLGTYPGPAYPTTQAPTSAPNQPAPGAPTGSAGGACPDQTSVPVYSASPIPTAAATPANACQAIGTPYQTLYSGAPRPVGPPNSGPSAYHPGLTCYAPTPIAPVRPMVPPTATGRRVCYLGPENRYSACASPGPSITKSCGAFYAFPNAETVAGGRHSACLYDAAGPSFQLSGLDPRKTYRLGFSWWDFDNGGRAESVTACGSGCTATLVEKTALPAYAGKRQMPVEMAVFLPRETLAAGSARIEFHNDSSAPNAVVGEIWLEELPSP